jgi:hypothetical protein
MHKTFCYAAGFVVLQLQFALLQGARVYMAQFVQRTLVALPAALCYVALVGAPALLGKVTRGF